MDIFKAWPKIHRIENRKEFYTEKIDGTNACVIFKIIDCLDIGNYNPINYKFINEFTILAMFAQSRNKIITIYDDNYGFAKWCLNNFEELSELGEGYHYGEWWGHGIQRGYGLDHKRFSLFNTNRWGDHNPNTPKCCHVVPKIEATSIEEAKQKLIKHGSFASEGFMNVEGVVIYDYLTNAYWKGIINK